jgi:hypothetical protein
VHDVVADDQLAGVQVAVLPPQRADLARPKPGGRLQPQEEVQLTVHSVAAWSACRACALVGIGRLALCGADGLISPAGLWEIQPWWSAKASAPEMTACTSRSRLVDSDSPGLRRLPLLRKTV